MPRCQKREPAGVRAHLLEELVRIRSAGGVRSARGRRLGAVGRFRSRCTTTLRARSRRFRLEVHEPALERATQWAAHHFLASGRLFHPRRVLQQKLVMKKIRSIYVATSDPARAGTPLTSSRQTCASRQRSAIGVGTISVGHLRRETSGV